MKKTSLVLCSMLLACSLSACGQSDNYSKLEGVVPETEENSVVDMNLPEVEEVSSAEDEKKEVTFTQEKADKASEYMQNCTYISVSQLMENGAKDGLSENSTSIAVIADTKNKISKCTSTMSSTDSNGNNEAYQMVMMSDAKTGANIYKTEDDQWIEADGTYKMLTWDLSQYEKADDVLKYLLKDCVIPVDTVGYESEGYEYYEVTRETTEDMVSGIKYDKLGDTVINYTYRQLNGVLILAACTVDVNYFVGQNEYYVRATIRVDATGSTDLAFPEYTRAGDIQKTDD